MMYSNHAKPIEIVEELYYIDDAQKLTINYKGGNSFHAKNVRDIFVGYDKGGKLVLSYGEDTLISTNTEYGTLEMEGVTTFSVTTGDIESLVIELYTPELPIRAKQVLEF